MIWRIIRYVALFCVTVYAVYKIMPFILTPQTQEAVVTVPEAEVDAQPETITTTLTDPDATAARVERLEPTPTVTTHERIEPAPDMKPIEGEASAVVVVPDNATEDSRANLDALAQKLAECAPETCTVLDLSDLSLTNLPAPLVNLDHIKELILPASITSLDALDGAEHLEALTLVGGALQDYDALANLPNLTRLTLTGSDISDVLPLGGLQKLESLSLARTQVRSLRPLAYLPNLKSINLRNTKIADLHVLEDLMSLEELTLPVLPASAISTLSKLEARGVALR